MKEFEYHIPPEAGGMPPENIPLPKEINTFPEMNPVSPEYNMFSEESGFAGTGRQSTGSTQSSRSSDEAAAGSCRRSGRFDAMSLVALALLIAECWVVSFVIKIFNRNVKLKSRHAETLKSLGCNFIKYVVVIYGLIFGLSILGVNMVAVIASLGVLGLIVGFGAQTLIEDVITGLFIIFEGQFHVGDIIAIDNYRGTVTSIGIRTTQITDAGGNIKVVNNSDIRTLVNLSEVASTAIADVGISYNADLEKAEQVILTLTEELPKMYPGIFHDRPTFPGVEELADSAVILRVVANVDEPNIYSGRRILLRELKLALDRSGIEIPFPQVVVHQE